MPRQVVTIRRAGSRCASFKVGSSYLTVPVWTVPRTRSRRSDNKETWRHVSSVGTTRAADRPSARLVAEARQLATQWGLSYVPGIRHVHPAT